MKAVMYHYVRPAPDGLAHFPYLHIDDFVQQLDWFERHHGFVSRQAFEAIRRGESRSAEGILLTFDDGLADHYRHVMPVLAERGLFGLFFVCSGPLERSEVLDVHRIHLLLGQLGGPEAMRRLSRFIEPGMLSDADVKEFRESTYRHQVNDQPTTLFKRTLNYWIAEDHRKAVLDQLFGDLFPDASEAASELYASREQLLEMDGAGMVIGGHTVSHNVLSRLPVERQRGEILGSLAFLSRLLDKPVTTFCHPYGGRHTFTSETISILEEAGCELTFAVEPWDVTEADLTSRRQALPRYDCNMFPRGKASIGRQRPVHTVSCRPETDCAPPSGAEEGSSAA